MKKIEGMIVLLEMKSNGMAMSTMIGVLSTAKGRFHDEPIEIDEMID